MAFYFFAELDKLNNQNTSGNGEAYGPISAASGKDRFRVTSTHKVSADAKVIAVCKGTILVQEQTGSSDLVNIILKPFEQPPFEFPKIKYFIYRGVKKSSLISGSTLVGKNTSDLTTSLWTDYNAYNNLSNQAPPYQLLGLGINTANSPYRNEDLIDGVFYQTGTDHQLPTVQAGWHIANFDDAVDIGFEIMFESLGFEPTLAIARKADNIIEVNTLTGTSQAEFFDHWHDKEDVLNYIDPCAFWGSFYANNLIVKLSNNTKNKKNGDELYADVLSLYKNKNKCYIDIRNEFNFSLNYFKNYGTNATNNTTNIKLGKGSNTITPIDYYTNGWPIFIIDNTGFSNTSNHYHEIRLQLPCGNGDNPAPLIYFSRAYKTGLKFPETFNLKQKFLPLTVSSNYTPVFNVAVPWISGNLCCSFIKIKLCKRKSTATLPTIIPTQIRRSDNIDAIFRTKMNFDSSAMNLTTKVFEEEIYIDAINTEGFDAAFNLGISFDANNVNLIISAENFNKLQNTKARTPLILSEFVDISEEDLITKISTKYYDTLLLKETLDTVDGDVDFLLINEPDESEIKFNIPDLKKSAGFTFTKVEWANLLDEVQLNNYLEKYPIFISITNKQVLTTHGKNYSICEVILKGYKEISNNISVQDSGTIIKIYNYGNV